MMAEMVPDKGLWFDVTVLIEANYDDLVESLLIIQLLETAASKE